MYSTCVDYGSASHIQDSLVSVTTYHVHKLIILSVRLTEHWLWDLFETGIWFSPQGLRRLDPSYYPPQAKLWMSKESQLPMHSRNFAKFPEVPASPINTGVG